MVLQLLFLYLGPGRFEVFFRFNYTSSAGQRDDGEKGKKKKGEASATKKRHLHQPANRPQSPTFISLAPQKSKSSGLRRKAEG